MIAKILIASVGLAAIVVMAATLFSEAPATDDEATDVIFLMGQSNAAYRYTVAVPGEAEPVPEPGEAWYYGTALRPARFDDPATCSIRAMSTASGSVLGDKWPSIAATYTEETGRSVLLAQLAEGGASIRLFSPSLPGRLWSSSVDMAAEVFDAMRAAGMTVGNVRILWIQGEQDAVQISVEDYKARLMEIGQTLAGGGLGCKVQLPIWISKTRGTGNAATAQLELAAEKPGVFRIASTLADTFTIENGLMVDQYHYSQKADNMLGSKIGGAMGDAAKASDKMNLAIWGIIGIGVAASVLFGAFAIFRR